MSLLKKLQNLFKPTEEEMIRALQIFGPKPRIVSTEHANLLGGLPPILPPKDVRADN